MADERWVRVKHLLNDALDQPPARRKEFLERACGDDAGLRRDVDSLLAQVDRTAGLMAEPVFDLADAVRLPSSPDPAAHAGVPSRTPQPPLPSSRGTFVWLALLLGATFTLLCGGAAWKAIRYAHAITHIGWAPDRVGGTWRVAWVDPDGPAGTTLLEGDEIVAFDGDSRAGVADPSLYLRYLQVGSTYTLRVRRGGQGEREAALRVLAHEESGLPAFALYGLLSVSFCAMGLVVGVARPHDRVTQIGCAAGITTAFRLLAIGLSDYRGVGHGATLALNEIILLSHPWHLAFGYHFLYLLAFSSRRSRVWSTANVVIYVVCAVMSAVSVTTSVSALRGPEIAIALQVAHPHLLAVRHFLFETSFPTYFQLLVFAAMCAMVLRGYRQAEDADHRRRIRWVVFGCVCGLAPLVLYLAAQLLLPRVGAAGMMGQMPWTAIFHGANACVVALPVSLAYAVAKHRVLGVSVVIRRSMQYLLANACYRPCCCCHWWDCSCRLHGIRTSRSSRSSGSARRTPTSSCC